MKKEYHSHRRMTEEVLSKLFFVRKLCLDCNKYFYCSNFCEERRKTAYPINACVCGYCDTAPIHWLKKCKKEGDFYHRRLNR